MARFTNALTNSLSTGYNLASAKKDKNDKTAYQRYIEKYYGPGVTSHTDPIAIARAATGAVEKGLKSGAGFLAHAAAGLLGAPMGPSQQGSRAVAGATNAPGQGAGGIGSDVGAVSGITPTNRLYGGNPGTGAGVSAYNPGSARQGMDGVLDAISQAEGTVKNGYNTVLGNGAYGNPSRPITDMTLQEVHDFGRNTLFAGQRAQGKKERDLSSATGRYQITGDNIKAYATKWGLDMKTTKWTPQLQDRIAIDLAKNTPKGLANWEGFKYRNGPTLKKQALAALNGQNVSSTVASASTTASNPQVTQLQQSLVAAGAKIPVDGIMGPQTRKAMADYPETASAYASTSATTSPAIQAATQQAQSRATSQSGQSGSITDRGERIAAMQRDLNSRGAKLTVDGLEGPLTRQAEQQFYGSPTSVRTPSFGPSRAYTSSGTQDEGRGLARQAAPPEARPSYVPSPSFTNRQSYTSGRGDEGTVPRVGVASTPAINQPYTNYGWADNSLNRQNELRDETASQRYRDFENQRAAARTSPYANSTGGANALEAQTPRYNAYEAQRAAAMSGPPITPRTVQAVPVTRTPYLNQPYTGPEWDVLPGLMEQSPTARLPRARPDQAPQQAVPTLIERLDNLVERAERALTGNRGSDSKGSSSRDGGGSRSGGGNYSGGNYGGQGGGRISEGVGGAFRNR